MLKHLKVDRLIFLAILLKHNKINKLQKQIFYYSSQKYDFIQV